MTQITAKAMYRNLRITPSKLNLVAAIIRKRPIAEALLQLEFSKKRVAREVKKCLESAIANAEYNHQLGFEYLVVDQVLVGKAVIMKRMMPRARGRGSKIHKLLSHLVIILKEQK